ncbi:cupin domain-containing protein [Mycolicibacterium austroafricanum]|uniref:cupin domain-containing protein n=1 Tax=Mycolicibacterium austroafricanum TaxID=39687 RepID=UPI001CA34D44|nr:cupin domain-containing protein [Mycolicibacterium austroafricanum]QZT60739.1 cupin domain-containing protein [Mycolicibacterium austroafricanum]
MLSRCIGVDREVFAAEYWGRKPLLSPAGALPRDFCDLLSPETVDELIAERGVRAPFIRLAKAGQVLAKDSYLGPAGFGAEVADQIDSAKVLSQLASGATVVLQGLHRLWPPLIDFVQQAVADIGHPVQANAYITPPDNRGFDFHHDVHDVFVLQVSGHKRWVVHEPAHRHPLPTQPWTDYRDQVAERTAAEPVIDTVLSEGDALYLPRGWVHAAQAMDTTSIHLTIGVSATTALDVARAVVDELSCFEEFRASLPMCVDPAGRDEMSATAAKVIAEVVSRLRDNAALLSTAAADRLISRHQTRTRPEAVRPLTLLDAAEQADTVRVRWRRGLHATVDHGTDGRVSMRLVDKTITFPASCAPALEKILTGGVTDAGHLPGLDAADGAVLLRRLLREGVVVPA